MKWNIWSEGYAATGDSSPAHLVAEGVEAATFKEACLDSFDGDALYDEKRNTYWGCRLFDNEAAARKSFG